MKKIFITGGTGLVGRAVLKTLAGSQFQILALKRPTSKIDDLPQSIEWVEGDLRDLSTFENQLSKASLLIHIGAKVDFNPNHGNRVIDFNVSTTKELVDFCVDHNIRMIYISSVAALGSLNDNSINENTPFDLDAINTHYALSKYLAEVEVWRGISEGLSAVILNPSIIIGIPSYFPESSGVFWQQIDKGLPRYPKGITGFVDARDIAIIIERLIDSDIAGESFILNAENLSFHYFFGLIAENISSKPPKKPLKSWQSNLLWRLSAVLRLFGFNASYNRAVHEISQRHFEYDASKIKAEFDFEFRPIEESIKWVSEAYLANR